MPMTPRCQPCAGDDEDVLRADLRIAVDRPARVREDLGLLLLAPRVLLGELAREPARARSRTSASRPRSSSRSTARSGELIRPAALSRGPSTKLDMKTVERLAERVRSPRAAPRGRRRAGPRDSARQAVAGDDAVLADERHDVGQRADRRDLDEVRQELGAASARREQRLHELERHADAGQVLVGIRAVRALRD